MSKKVKITFYGTLERSRAGGRDGRSRSGSETGDWRLEIEM